jgi:hypothetical protein
LEPIDLRDLQIPNWAEAVLSGDRSRIDACVITALVRAGASNGQIHYLFEKHAPSSKFAEKNGDGKRYLELSISNARSFLSQHPPVNLSAQERAA